MGGETRLATTGFIRRSLGTNTNTRTPDRVAARPRRLGTREVKKTVKGSTSYAQKYVNSENNTTRMKATGWRRVPGAQSTHSVRLGSYTLSQEAGKLAGDPKKTLCPTAASIAGVSRN